MNQGKAAQNRMELKWKEIKRLVFAGKDFTLCLSHRSEDGFTMSFIEHMGFMFFEHKKAEDRIRPKGFRGLFILVFKREDKAPGYEYHRYKGFYVSSSGIRAAEKKAQLETDGYTISLCSWEDWLPGVDTGD